MVRYQGEDYRSKFGDMRKQRKELENERRGATKVARELFPAASSIASDRTATHASWFLRRANELLLKLEGQGWLFGKLAMVGQQGARALPGTFAPELIQIMKAEAAILARVCRRNEMHRDSPGMSGALIEDFQLRFAAEAAPDMRSPETPAEWKAREALIGFFESEAPQATMEEHRAAVETIQREGEELAPAPAEAEVETELQQPLPGPDGRARSLGPSA